MNTQENPLITALHKPSDNLHYLRRTYTSKTLVEFLPARKMNLNSISNLKLHLPLKHCSYLTQKQACLLSSSKSLKTLSIRAIIPLQPSKQDEKIFNDLIMNLKNSRSVSKLTILVMIQHRDASKELEQFQLR